MGRLPEQVLGEIRSPAEALADLVTKFNETSFDHPDRPMWERMIRQLEFEIVLRGGPWRGHLRKTACAETRFSPWITGINSREMAMIVEMRTYRVKPGSIPEVVKRFGEALEKSGRNKVAPLGGFFHTEVGPLNRIIHCWPYESLGAREKLRAEAMKLQGWPPPIGEFIEEMESKIINLAPFSPALGDRGLGNIYEIRTYTMLPGALPTVTEKWAERIEGRTKLSPLAFCGSTELGGLNQWIHVWAYKDAAERFRIRAEAQKTGAWPPATRGQFVRQENMFVIPAAFSPLH